MHVRRGRAGPRRTQPVPVWGRAGRAGKSQHGTGTGDRGTLLHRTTTLQVRATTQSEM
jgi:hypothetical protein